MLSHSLFVPALNWEIRELLCFTPPSLGSDTPKNIPHSAVSSKFCLQASLAVKATTNIMLILQLRGSRLLQPGLLHMNWLHAPFVPWKCLVVKTSPFWSSHNRRRKVRDQGLFFPHSRWHCTENIKRLGFFFFQSLPRSIESMSQQLWFQNPPDHALAPNMSSQAPAPVQEMMPEPASCRAELCHGAGEDGS